MRKRLLSFQVIIGSVLFFTSGIFFNLVYAEACKSLIPHGAEVVRDFWLCTSEHTGQSIIYSCRDYKTGNNHYRLYYKGGTLPKAIAHINNNNYNATLRYLNQPKQHPVCEIAPPEGVPKTTKYLGSGVCENEHGQPVPCSLFKHAPGRQLEIYHYMVFYDGFGNGPSQIDAQLMGTNTDAMVAELAYQIGLGLLNTVCCQQQALAYLAYAYELFPDFDKYRDTYQARKLEAEPIGQNVPCLEIAESW